ncbi:hypothetical protein B0H13DRAFT_1477304, partial [Mycena leptocephala]
DHIFSNPIADLDLIAQMTVLLAIICNVILHLGTDPCNFILEMVKVIVNLVLASNGSQNETQREFVVEQLPPNLHAALQAFKIDSTTTIYAVCPSCSFTHAPKE